MKYYIFSILNIYVLFLSFVLETNFKLCIKAAFVWQILFLLWQAESFKSLASSKEKKEPSEFEQQRQASIAEAMQAKEGTTNKNFGVGSAKQVCSMHYL